MDDEMILARGGTQEDINAYAERNGADLTREDFMIEEVLKEFEETFSGVDNDGTYKQCIANDVKDWLKEKLTAFEKSVKEEFLKSVLPEENLDEDNIQYANGWNVCRENIINKANNI